MTATTDSRPSPAADAVPAVDLYRDIHKGIRAELFGAAVQAGATDPSDRTARLELAARVDGLVGTLASHAEHEDRAVQPAIEVHVPAVAERIVTDHHVLDARIQDLHELSLTVADTCGPAARTAAHELYLELASFTSHGLQAG